MLYNDHALAANSSYLAEATAEVGCEGAAMATAWTGCSVRTLMAWKSMPQDAVATAKASETVVVSILQSLEMDV